MEPRKVVEAWVEAFNKADADLISSYYTDDATNHKIANREVVKKEAITQHPRRYQSASASRVSQTRNLLRLLYCSIALPNFCRV
jgi:ketosteroid isomerase-like protein